MGRLVFGVLLGLLLGLCPAYAASVNATAPGLRLEEKVVMRGLYERMSQEIREKQLSELRGRELNLNRRLNGQEARNEQSRLLILGELSRLHDEIDIAESVFNQTREEEKVQSEKAQSFFGTYGDALMILGGLAALLALVLHLIGRRSIMDLSGGRVDNGAVSKADSQRKDGGHAVSLDPLPAAIPLQDMQTHVDHLMRDNLTPYNTVVTFLFEQAILWHASDIHIQREGAWVEVRFRLDGQLFPACSLHPRGERDVLNIIKNMTRLKVYENRAAQEGRLEYFFGGRWYDLRISIMPVHDSEKVVARNLRGRRDRLRT